MKKIFIYIEGKGDLLHIFWHFQLSSLADIFCSLLGQLIMENLLLSACYLPVGTHTQLYQSLSSGCTRMIQEAISEQGNYFCKILFFFWMAEQMEGSRPPFFIPRKQAHENSLYPTAEVGLPCWGSVIHVTWLEPLETLEEQHIWLACTTQKSPWVPFKFLVRPR